MDMGETKPSKKLMNPLQVNKVSSYWNSRHTQLWHSLFIPAFFLASYKSTTGGYQSVEVVYESTPEQQLSYQESTYQAPTSEETTYQDTPPQPIYQQSTEYSEEPTSSESYYAKIRESQSNNEDNELIQEIEALEQKLDVLQEEIQNYLNE